MSRPSLLLRARRRMGREVRAVRHTLADGRLLRAFQRHGLLSASEMREAADRLRENPARDPHAYNGLVLRVAPAAQLDRWRGGHRDWSERAVGQASEPLRDRISLFGRSYELATPEEWHRDPLRAKPWPRRAHAHIRFDDPDRPGDVRMQWEPARFHHALLLGRAWLATQDPAYPEAFLRQVDSFERANPPFRSIHWGVGMEVAIRATAWVFALEFFRGAPVLRTEWRERLIRALLLHGVFLEHHLERHFLGFTTNHTVADYAGLAVLGKFFGRYDCGRRWSSLAAAGLDECFQEQVLIGGAHAEGSLPYERFVLEAGLVAALSLEGHDAVYLRKPLKRMARHLRDTCLPQGLPFVGDGDESFFPPFGFLPYAQRDPLDPEPVLQVAAEWLCTMGLRLREETEEAAYWLGTAPEDRRDQELVGEEVLQASMRRSEEANFWAHRGSGCLRFECGPFTGVLVSRAAGEGWVPTHAHNDLLSIVLDVNDTPLLIDPGTGGYGCDRALRNELRSTGAHSTVQLDALEQSPLRERAIFEGPAAVPGGVDRYQREPLRLCAWHGGFLPPDSKEGWLVERQEVRSMQDHRRSWEDARSGTQHTRRLSWRLGQLCIEDIIFIPAGSGDATGWVDPMDPDVTHTTALRFRLAPGLAASLDARGAACRVEVPGGIVRFLVLRPREALWQIQPGAASRRYGERVEAPVLEAVIQGPLPHRWLTVLQYQPNERQE